MVTEDSKVLEEGEVVDDDLANVLTELGIEPKEVGLDLKGVYSEGVLFEPDELEIDVDEYEADIRSAAAAARNLSVNAAYPTAATAGTLLAKASGEAKSVGLFAEIESPDVVPDLIGRPTPSSARSRPRSTTRRRFPRSCRASKLPRLLRRTTPTRKRNRRRKKTTRTTLRQPTTTPTTATTAATVSARCSDNTTRIHQWNTFTLRSS